MPFEAIHKLPSEGGGGKENFGACKIRVLFFGPWGRGETFPQKNARGLILQGLFEDMQKCNSLNFTGAEGDTHQNCVDVVQREISMV